MDETPGKLSSFGYAFGWNSFYRDVLGICSVKNESFIAQQRAWAWAFLILLFIWMPQVASLHVLRHDMNLMIDCLSTNMSMTVSIAKILVLQYQRKVIGSILDAIADDWIGVKPKIEQTIMLETARISRFISILSVSLTIVMFSEWIISQLWILLRHNDTDVDPRLSFGLLQTSYFPFDTKRTIVFASLWIGQFFTTLISMLSYSGPDSIVSMMVLHVCGQLRIVLYCLKNLVDDSTVREPDRFWKKLSGIVVRHDQLNQKVYQSLNFFHAMRLASAINDTFSSILLVQMLICSVTFCFQGYAMFTNLMGGDGAALPVFDIAFCVLYSIYTVIHLFIYCYVGDRLLVESTSICDAFYETAWYNLSAKEARAFLFVCHRSNIPLQLTAGKFCTFNLQLFNTILKNSMGYLSMLMAMKDRLID